VSPAEGATTTEVLADFPSLSEVDVRAAIALRDRTVVSGSKFRIGVYNCLGRF
jgi:uncharacterized protein (DUF433 family)